ncbi:MAG TPA: response regulator transcription factor [Thermodesulfobacteriaceae bacterium]|nr:response regulator transcription factor [Thermodesulfobacteriaceae bacterium]
MDARRILVIEDDEDILTVLKDQLELDGFEVAGAGTGQEGLKRVWEWHPDLLILDLNLPDLDGIKICRNIRKSSNLPIIMLTARESLSDKVRGLECGADDYIVKPFEYLELAARIRACLRRHTSAYTLREDKYDYGILKILPKKRQVLRFGEPVRLTKREFDLLELLVSYMGDVLSRDFISSQLWPKEEVYSWSRAIDVHIRRLRQKIEPDPENPRFIHTHTGVGYRFEGDNGD